MSGILIEILLFHFTAFFIQTFGFQNTIKVNKYMNYRDRCLIFMIDADIWSLPVFATEIERESSEM